MFYRVTLLDLMIAKIMGDEPLSKDEIPVFLSHAELIASTFVDQCKTVLKLTSEQHADDEVREQTEFLTQPGPLRTKALKTIIGTFLMAQWLSIRLPVQGTRVQALVREDPTCRRATKPVPHNC